jgi:hypothetical protein
MCLADPVECLLWAAISIVFLAVATPGHAGSLKLSLSCSESVSRDIETSKIFRKRFGPKDLIRFCLTENGVSSEEVAFSDYRVIFDHAVVPVGELRVVRRSGAPMCSLSEPALFVGSPTPPSPPPIPELGKQLNAVLYDWNAGDWGNMLCTLRVKTSTDCKKYDGKRFDCRLITKRSASCEGSVLFNELPCTLKLKSKSGESISVPPGR